MDVDGKQLTEEYEEIYEEFRQAHDDGGCTCFLNPPCGYCTHPGNPSNLEETEEAWVPADPDAVMKSRDKDGNAEFIKHLDLTGRVLSTNRTPAEQLMFALNTTVAAARKITTWG